MLLSPRESNGGMMVSVCLSFVVHESVYATTSADPASVEGSGIQSCVWMDLLAFCLCAVAVWLGRQACFVSAVERFTCLSICFYL